MYRTSSLLALSLALAAPAYAADEALDATAAGDAAADAGFDQEGAGSIVVTGTRDRYGVEETTSATRTPTPLNDVPQSVTIVTEAQIEDQGLRSIGDVLRYVPGATVGQGEGHRDQITLRGNNSTADFFVDGLRDDVQYYRGLYNVERVEVLKGPNAMIFGRGGGGGVVNRVLKRPAANAFQAGSLSIDNEGAWSADVDLNQPFGEAAAVRLNGVYERFDSHRRFLEGERYAINPTGSVSIGGRTRIDLSYEYDRDERTVDRGVPSAFAGTRANPAPPLAGSRDAFFGDPAINELDFEAHVVRGRLEHRFSDSLSLTSRVLYGDYDKGYQNVFAATPVAAGKVGLEAYRDIMLRESFITQTDLVWETKTGGIGHVILAGFEYSDQDSVLERTNGFFSGPGTITNGGRRITVDLANAAASRPTLFNVAGTGYRLTGTDAEVLAFYAQDQISFGDHFDIVAGLRFDRFRLGVTNLVSGQRFARTDELWSPRLGLVAKPMENLSFYASYSRSYRRQHRDAQARALRQL
jgi:catecholate siderophore receptor